MSFTPSNPLYSHLVHACGGWSEAAELVDAISSAGGAISGPVVGNTLLVVSGDVISQTQTYDQANDEFVWQNTAGIARIPDHGVTGAGACAGSFEDVDGNYTASFGCQSQVAAVFHNPTVITEICNQLYGIETNGGVRFTGLAGPGAGGVVVVDSSGNYELANIFCGANGNALISDGTGWRSSSMTPYLTAYAKLAAANTFTVSPQTIIIDADAHKGIVVKGHSATQSASLQEWQNSSGAAVSLVNANGEFSSPNPATGAGTFNERFGISAGRAMTVGATANAAFGAFALPACTIGTYNMAVGYSALLSCVDGSFNVAVGGFALPLTVSGVGNVALGFSAAFSNTSGSSNMCIGTQAGYYNTTGSNNINIGVNAGLGQSGQTTGSSNVNLGLSSGQLITTGSTNINLGTQAGFACTVGNNNVCIGYNSGYTAVGANANVTGSQNTWVGTNAGPASTTQLTDSIAIGYNANVLASNTGVLGGTGTDAVRMGVCAGGSTTYAKFGGKIAAFYVTNGNTTTTETDLFTYTVPASVLAANGDSLRVRFGLTLKNHATATRQLRVYFAGILLWDSGAQLATTATTYVQVDVMIVRSDVAVCHSVISCIGAGFAPTQTVVVDDGTLLTGLTFSGTNIIKITGQAAAVGAASNDIRGVVGELSWQPAP